MFTSTSIFWGVTIGLGIASIIGFLFLLYWLAVRYNFLFTVVEEGTAKAIMRGGNIARMVLAYDGFHLNRRKREDFDPDQPIWTVIQNQQQDDQKDTRGYLEKFFGLYFVGIPFVHRVYEYDFEWTEQRQTKDGGYEAYPRKKRTDFVYVKDFVYLVILKGAETKNKLPIDILYLITVRIKNPYRALFKIEDWLNRTVGASNSIVRDYTGNLSFEQLVSEAKKQSNGTSSFSQSVIALNDNLLNENNEEGGKEKGLVGLYGVKIVSSELQSVELSGDLGVKARESTTKVYVATQDAEVVGITAEAEKKRIASIYTELEKHPELAPLIRQFEAVEKSGEKGNTIVWANDFIQLAVAKLVSQKKGTTT